MDLYSTLTVKDWSKTLGTSALTLQLILAIQNHNTLPASISLSELVNRGKSAIVESILEDLIENGTIESDKIFSESFQNALLYNCVNDPILLPYCNFILATNSWPHSKSDLESSESLIKDYFKKAISPVFSALPKEYLRFGFYTKEYGCYPCNNIGTGKVENMWLDIGERYELDLNKSHEIDYRDEYQFPNILVLLRSKKIPFPLPPLTKVKKGKDYTYRNNRWEEISKEENHIFYISYGRN